MKKLFLSIMLLINGAVLLGAAYAVRKPKPIATLAEKILAVPAITNSVNPNVREIVKEVLKAKLFAQGNVIDKARDSLMAAIIIAGKKANIVVRIGETDYRLLDILISAIDGFDFIGEIPASARNIAHRLGALLKQPHIRQDLNAELIGEMKKAKALAELGEVQGAQNLLELALSKPYRFLPSDNQSLRYTFNERCADGSNCERTEKIMVGPILHKIGSNDVSPDENGFSIRSLDQGFWY